MHRSRVNGFLVAAVTLLATACDKGVLSRPDGGQIAPAGAAGMSGSSGIWGTAGHAGITGGSGSSGVSCGARFPAPPAPLDVLILLDASASMNDDTTNASCSTDCGTSSKWAQITSAINAVVSSDSSVRWGLGIFPALSPPPTGAGCTTLSTPDVAVGARNADAIGAAIAARTRSSGGVSDGGNTPTRAAVNAAAQHLLTLTDDLQKKTILLITDGAPDCAEDTSADDANATVDAIFNAAIMGFLTQVLGVATADGDANQALSRMAAAGGYWRDGPAPYRTVRDTTETIAALRAAVADESRCLFEIPAPPDSNVDRYHVSVLVGGMAVPRDPTRQNGWDYGEPTSGHLQLFGPVCDAVDADRAIPVEVVFNCLLK